MDKIKQKNVQEDVQNPFTVVHKSVLEDVQDVQKPVHMNVSERSRNTKSRKIAVKNRNGGLLKKVMPLLAFAGAMGGTLLYLPVIWQFTLWLFTLSIFFFCDPFDALGRILAPQSLRICGSIILLAALNLWYKDAAMLVITILLSAAGFAGIWYGNQYWMDAHNWEYSPAVQKALYMAADADSPAMNAWISHGKRETRTALIELGLDHDDNILDVYARPIYLCGWLNGRQKTAKLRQALTRSKEQTERLQAKIEPLKEKNEDLKRTIKDLKAQLENAKEADKTFYLSGEIKQLKKQIEGLKAENEQLRNANTELLQDIPDVVERAEKQNALEAQTAENLQERARAMQKSGMSYAQIGKALNISKTKAFNLCKEEPEKVEEKKEGTVIQLHRSAGAM